MSQLTRALFNEFRPFFDLLDDTSDSPFYSSGTGRRQFADPYSWQATRPALNLSTDNDTYIIEAEVPGVKKENLDVRVGDGGRSMTIEGRVVRGDSNAASSSATPATTASAPKSDAEKRAEGQSAALTTTKGKHSRIHMIEADTDTLILDSQKEVGQYSGSWSGTRTFTRTVWLPEPINPSEVKAKLEDGILTIRAGRANMKSFNIAVD